MPDQKLAPTTVLTSTSQQLFSLGQPSWAPHALARGRQQVLAAQKQPEAAVLAHGGGFSKPVLDTDSQAHPVRIYCFRPLVNAKSSCDGWAGHSSRDAFCNSSSSCSQEKQNAMPFRCCSDRGEAHRAGTGKGAALCGATPGMMDLPRSCWAQFHTHPCHPQPSDTHIPQ